MPTIVLTSRFKFGPDPAGQTHLSYASLEAPEDAPDGIAGMYGRDYAPDEREAPHAPEPGHHHRPHARHTGHHHRPHKRELEESPRRKPRPDMGHHHRPFDRMAGHHHRPHEKRPADEFLTPYDRRLTDVPLEDKPGQDWAAHPDPKGFVPHQKVKSALVRRGFSTEEASAITGNLIYESGGNQYPGNPVILNPPTGGNTGDAAWGSAQWEGKRKAGLTSPSLDDQVEHIWNEMHGDEPGATAAYAAMRRADTVAEKAAIVNRMYERPQYPGASERDRVRLANEAYRGGGDEAAGPALAAAAGRLGGDAADVAETMEGLHDHDPEGHKKITEFLRTGGHGMDPATTDWCASFVGAALHHAGVRDIPQVKGGDVANAYQNWGTPIDAKDVQRGDVVITPKSTGGTGRPGAMGGHLSIATGPLDADNEIPVIEGDTRAPDWRRGHPRHMVKRDWETPSPRLMFRRPPESTLAEK